MDVAGWERDVRLIGELCVELAGLGLKVRLTDTHPALYVRRAGDDQLHRIEVRDGECFAWDGGKQQHAVADPVGAAARIAALVRRPAEPDPGLRPCVGRVGEPAWREDEVCSPISLRAALADDPAELVRRLVAECRRAELLADVLEPCTKVRVNLRAGTSRSEEIITLKPNADEMLCWWWRWGTPICVATDIDQAVTAIISVISVVDL